MKNSYSSPLCGAIRRSFGSIHDFERAMENAGKHGGNVYLVALPDDSLQIVCAAGPPCGTVLMQADEPCPPETLSARYERFRINRPKYPCP